MKQASILFWLWLCSFAVAAQQMGINRFLTKDYRPQQLEQAVKWLTATNVVGVTSPVEYKAGQSIIFLPGFEVKPGTIFTAHTGTVSLFTLSAESNSNQLAVTAYPNPFTEVATITYILAKASRVTLLILDTQGKLIKRLVDEPDQVAGYHQIEWKSSEVVAGSYICMLQAGVERVSTRIIRK